MSAIVEQTPLCPSLSPQYYLSPEEEDRANLDANRGEKATALRSCPRVCPTTSCYLCRNKRRLFIVFTIGEPGYNVRSEDSDEFLRRGGAKLKQRKMSASTPPPSADDGSGELTLYVKAGENGAEIGDCPFAHFVRLVAALRGLALTVEPLTPSNKPQWLLDGYGGSLPCLVPGRGRTAEALVESSVIAEFVNNYRCSTTPAADNSERIPPLDAGTGEADAAVAGLFPAIAKFLKNTATDPVADGSGGEEGSTDPAKSAEEEEIAQTQLTELEKALFEKLETLNRHLEAMLLQDRDVRKRAGYLGGMTMAGGPGLGMADCSLAPKLYHLQVAGRHYHPRFMREAFDATVEEKAEGAAGEGGTSKDPQDAKEGGSAKSPSLPLRLGAIKAYMEALFQHPTFLETVYPEDQVIWGWGNARKG